MESMTVYGDVMRGKQRFSYMLSIAQDEWRGKVFRADGSFHGWVACSVVKPKVSPADAEPLAHDWIGHCIVHRVGLD